jgi:hypothetical protein
MISLFSEAVYFMFGSDQMTWPDAIGMAVETIEKADFLSDEQKRDILYGAGEPGGAGCGSASPA